MCIIKKKKNRKFTFCKIKNTPSAGKNKKQIIRVVAPTTARDYDNYDNYGRFARVITIRKRKTALCYDDDDNTRP